VSRPLEERRGLGWLAVGVVPLIVSFVPLALPAGWVEGLPVAFTPLLHLSSQLFFPAAVLVAVLRQRLWGLDLVVSRALLWALLTAAVVASYFVAVAALSPWLARDRAPEVLATALVAAGFQPARAWLQRRVDRLVRGDAANPLRAVPRAGTIGARGDAEETLAGLAGGLATSLRLGSVAIEVPAPATGGRHDGLPGEDGPDGLRTVARVGSPVGEQVVVPLVSPHGPIGRLVVTARPGERLDNRSRASLDDVGPVVATTVELAATTRALGRSRRRLAAARDEERRSLRRELHDGLGPALAGINLGLQAARNQLATDPALAAQLLDRISTELEGRVEEVRGLARGLLPPALGELGLEPALEGMAERYAVTGLSVGLAVEPDAVAQVPPEVADSVYAIVSEAVRNVHRHAGATSCVVAIRQGPGLEVTGIGDAVPAGGLIVTISDDGGGLEEGTPLGVGLVSMRERAEGLGGTLAMTRSPLGGAQVEVRVPQTALAVAG
jgi:signal transduction histidine kinase